jgi:hypothetical protein
MPRYDSSTAEVLVFTFKEGMLSAVAHDLKLKVMKFTLELDLAAGHTKGEFDAGSLKLICPMKDGQDNPSALPSILHPQVQENIMTAVDAKKHPRIAYEATTISDTEVAGTLTLHSKTRPLRGKRHDTATHIVAEFRFDQRDFGIKPFSAMLGTLKVKPEVVVRVTVPKA